MPITIKQKIRRIVKNQCGGILFYEREKIRYYSDFSAVMVAAFVAVLITKVIL